jgi:hypothetical protein
MSYSAKSLIQKAKDIEAIETARREKELKINKEQKRQDDERKKADREFIKVIGSKCIERALNSHYNCVITDEELKMYSSQIKLCNLDINKIELTADELENDFPEIFEQLKIEDKLNAIESELKELNEKFETLQNSNVKLLDKNLAKCNDKIYDLIINALNDDWELAYIEMKMLDEIGYHGFDLSSSYSSDQEMYLKITELLERLKKYEFRGFNAKNSDSYLASPASDSIQELMDEIPTAVNGLKNHKSTIAKVRKQIEIESEMIDSKIDELKEMQENLLERSYKLNIIQWLSEGKVSSDNYFPNQKTLSWIMNNPLMEDIFKVIEKKILERDRSYELILNEYGSRYLNNQYLCDGLYLDDFLIEISINDFQNIFNSLGYSTKLTAFSPKAADPSNLIQKHLLKISWPGFK